MVNLFSDSIEEFFDKQLTLTGNRLWAKLAEKYVLMDEDERYAVEWNIKRYLKAHRRQNTSPTMDAIIEIVDGYRYEEWTANKR